MVFARKMIVVCADDYGLSGGVCDAIEQLIAAGRLSATGAMTGLPAWRRRAGSLRQTVASSPADIGLHFTLTEQRPITAAPGLAVDGRLPTIGRLIRQSLAGALPSEAVRTELRAQLDAFEDVWGAPPDFIDGHQHAHLLPGVRGVVIEEMAARYADHPIWMRACAEAPAEAARRRVGLSKALVIGSLGAGLGRAAAKRGVPTNDSFRGLYDFSDRLPYREVFRASLKGSGRRILVHCHPGIVDEELRALDPLLEPRERELAYLSSDACGEDLAAAGLHPARFRDIGA
ncbi:ChbG/HpnK family deacetylase [Bosea sp. 117]|uniref:ChbG/HpnK family deacetylase n=1 Tax=Bosea sp. 117 TaxID=1125973 RepID=UPI0004940F52|nr:ChbG/HpnK family deacetylase [Bosea sp. 117]